MAIFYNQASLSYNGFTTNSNITEGQLVDTLSATKTAISQSYGANDTVTYAISIINSGNTAATGVSVTDNLGAYSFGGATLRPLDYVVGSARLFINGAPAAAPTVEYGDALVISGFTIPAGASAMIIYEATTNAYAPLGQGASITNSAVITAAGVSITATATVVAASDTSLTIAKALSPDTVSDGDELTYTFIIQNTGNAAADADAGVSVTDVFNPILNGISVSLNGAELPATSYTYNEATGEFVTAPGAITVPAATYAQDSETGVVSVTPGVAILTVTGTV